MAGPTPIVGTGFQAILILGDVLLGYKELNKHEEFAGINNLAYSTIVSVIKKNSFQTRFFLHDFYWVFILFSLVH
jgi:hypothetical protein